MELKWYDKIAIWTKIIWLILIHGLEDAANKANIELKELERHLTSGLNRH